MASYWIDTSIIKHGELFDNIIKHGELFDKDVVVESEQYYI